MNTATAAPIHFSTDAAINLACGETDDDARFTFLPDGVTCTSCKAAAEARVCYVCGGPEHEPTELHRFWSIADARRDFAAEPVGTIPSMTAAETLDPREAINL